MATTILTWASCSTSLLLIPNLLNFPAVLTSTQCMAKKFMLRHIEELFFSSPTFMMTLSFSWIQTNKNFVIFENIRPMLQCIETNSKKKNGRKMLSKFATMFHSRLSNLSTLTLTFSLKPSSYSDRAAKLGVNKIRFRSIDGNNVRMWVNSPKG
jgi:hypothetical protein